MSIARLPAHGSLGGCGNPSNDCPPPWGNDPNTKATQAKRLLFWSWPQSWCAMEETCVILHQLRVTIKVLEIGIQRGLPSSPYPPQGSPDVGGEHTPGRYHACLAVKHGVITHPHGYGVCQAYAQS